MNILRQIKQEKVAWKNIGEIFSTRTGYTPSKSNNKYWENGIINWFTIEDIRQRGRILDYANVKIAKQAVKKQPFQKDSLILSTIATIGEYALIKSDFVVNQQFMVFTLKDEFKKIVNMYYMRYYFYKISEYCKRNKRIGNVPTIDTNKILNLPIPIPSLTTQEKIVKILDKFTTYNKELQKELQKELTLRIKQYEYYRDLLLSEEYITKLSKKLDGKMQEKRLRLTTLGEISQINRGASPRPIKNYLTDDKNGVPWIKIGDIDKNSKYITKTAQKITVEGSKKSRLLKKGDFILSNSMSYGRPYILNINGAIHDGWACISEFNEFLISDFLYYYLTSFKVQKYWKKKMNTSSVSNLNSNIIGSLPIFLPSLKVQNFVVSILDKFNTLVNDITLGIPREIDLRQKQYEYYREKLLDFDK